MKKKSNLILLAVLALAIGYAAVTTTLNLSGITIIGENSDDFDVYFSNAKEDGVEKKRLIKDDTHIVFKKELKSVKETYTLEYDVTNGSRTYDANIAITCTESNEYLKITNEFDTSTNLPATETRSGKLTVEVIKSYVGTTEADKTLDTTISCEITGNAQERTSRATGTPAAKVVQEKPWKLTNDADNNGEISLGDLITLGTESFYVYSVDGDNVKAMAQYNLLVGNSYDGNEVTPLENPTGLQDASAIGWNSSKPYIGTVAFDSNIPHSNVYADSTIKPYVDAYATKLNELNGQVSDASLITKEELDALGCSDYTCKGAPAFVIATSYWTSSPGESDSDLAWFVFSGGNLGHVGNDIANCHGVRPVITISKLIIE